MSLGVKIKELRMENKESLQGVADSLGISKTHIWELERETASNPSLNLLKKIAEHFNESIHNLTSEIDSEEVHMNFARKIGTMNLSESDIKILEATAKALKNK